MRACRFLRFSALPLASVVLGLSPVQAQQAGAMPLAPDHAEPYDLGGSYTLHVASGVLVPGDDTDTFAPSSGCGNFTTNAFVNIDASQLYYTNTVLPTQEWVDWGTISADTTSDVVVQLTFGYATWMQDPSLGGPGATIEIRFYSDYQAPCTTGVSGTATEVARFVLTGLPGHTGGAYARGYYLTLDLRGGEEFVLPKGVFGFGYLNPNLEQTGIIESYAGNPKGSMTSPDANGQVTALDVWSPDVATGTCDGPLFLNPDTTGTLCGSHYLLLRKYNADPTPPATATVRNDSGSQNPVEFSAVGTPVLGTTFHLFATPDIAARTGVYLFGFAAPFEVSTPYGVLLIDPSDPGGELLAGAGLNGPHAFGSGYTVVPVTLPPDTLLCGFDFSLQAVEYGAGYQLTNAIDMTLGLR